MIKKILNTIIPLPIRHKLAFRKNLLKAYFTGYAPAPANTDKVGYESLLRFIKEKGIHKLNGDFVEIGALLGGGSFKLSFFLDYIKSDKTLYVIDVFDPSFDSIKNDSGQTMAQVYSNSINLYNKGEYKSQWDIFHEINKNRKNIKVLKEDSKKVKIPSDKIAFAFIDGNHTPEYVESDFYLIWNKLVNGGAVAFHDYKGDLPETSNMIDKLLERHDSEIDLTFHIPEKTILFIVKK